MPRSQPDYLIRLAEPDDLPPLPSIELRAVQQFRTHQTETGLTEAVLNNVTELDELEDAQRRGQLWVAVSPHGELVGFAQMAVLDGMAHLDEIDVVPEHGGRGVGSRLVETVCRWAAEAGYRKVTLSTFRDVPWNRPFYERRGFRVVESSTLPPEHQALLALERQRGLRTDLRVVMQRAL